MILNYKLNLECDNEENINIKIKVSDELRELLRVYAVLSDGDYIDESYDYVQPFNRYLIKGFIKNSLSCGTMFFSKGIIDNGEDTFKCSSSYSLQNIMDRLKRDMTFIANTHYNMLGEKSFTLEIKNNN